MTLSQGCTLACTATQVMQLLGRLGQSRPPTGSALQASLLFTRLFYYTTWHLSQSWGFTVGVRTLSFSKWDCWVPYITWRKPETLLLLSSWLLNMSQLWLIHHIINKKTHLAKCQSGEDPIAQDSSKTCLQAFNKHIQTFLEIIHFRNNRNKHF